MLLSYSSYSAFNLPTLGSFDFVMNLFTLVLSVENPFVCFTNLFSIGLSCKNISGFFLLLNNGNQEAMSLLTGLGLV